MIINGQFEKKTILEKILNPLPLKIPECIPGIIGLVEK